MALTFIGPGTTPLALVSKGVAPQLGTDGTDANSGPKRAFVLGLARTAGATDDTDPDGLPCLVLDLDGTLLQTNVLAEYALVFLKRHPFQFFRLFFWLLRGRAYLKQELARYVPLDATMLPVNQSVVDYAVGEKRKGRRIYLATAADQSIAVAVASRYAFFDGVLASDGVTNLKGGRKAELIEQMLETSFSYAGDSRADFPVWARACEVVIIGPHGWARRVARRYTQPTVILPIRWWGLSLLKSARPHQWAKNMLVFVPGLLGGTLDEAPILLDAVLAFVALGLVASSTYLLNDLWDLADDRRHWSKRRRPLASGGLPITTAIVAAPAGLIAGFLVGLVAGPEIVVVLAAYVAMTLAYSLGLKRIPVLDVTLLAGLFTMRAGARHRRRRHLCLALAARLLDVPVLLALLLEALCRASPRRRARAGAGQPSRLPDRG